MSVQSTSNCICRWDLKVRALSGGGMKLGVLPSENAYQRDILSPTDDEDADFYIYMDCLFLTEKSRSLGLGEKLINRIKQECKRLQCNHIQWQTPDFNTRAMKFYNRIGAKSKTKQRYFLEV